MQDRLEDILPPAPVKTVGPGISNTIGKMIVVGLLILLFLIPLAIIKNLIGERLARRDEAVAGITSTWGKPQTIAGPVMVIPYRFTARTIENTAFSGRRERLVETVENKSRIYLLPSSLRIDGDLRPDRLHRGIYEAVIYRGNFALTGEFAKPDFAELNIAPEDILWDEAAIGIVITDLRGARNTLIMAAGGKQHQLTPGFRLGDVGSGVHSRLAGNPFGEQPLSFSFELAVNGSKGISFIPLGTQSQVRLKSVWPDPGFSGLYLPTERTVSPSGFDAAWNVSYYSRNYPQQWTDREKEFSQIISSVAASAFGVDLLTVVDSYRNVERAVKYGLLFVVLVFVAFFLFEILAAIRIHPFQYSLVGLALCLFFLVLLSLSEVLSFGAAYLAGAGLSTVLITLYCCAALRSRWRAAIVAVELVCIYGFLYVLLCLQDYSLLLGSGGLLLALALVMYVTRSIDWYHRDDQKTYQGET